MDKTHINHTPHVSLQLRYSDLCPLSKLLSPHALQGILVGLEYQVLKEGRGEEKRDANGRGWKGGCGPGISVNGCSVIGFSFEDQRTLSTP